MSIKDVIFNDDCEFNDEDNIGYSEIVHEEAVVDEAILEDVADIKKEGRLNRTNKFINWALRISSILLCCSALYMNSLYAPGERDMNMDNLFDDTSAVVINDYQVESICSMLEDEFGIDLDSENDNSLLINAIYCNDSLTDSEKEFCCRYLDLFNDNPYLDKNRVYHALLNVDISYKNRPHFYEDSVEGVYIDDLKSIGIFVDDDGHVLAHELVHCILANDGELPTFFIEGVTELLANEYFSSSPFLEFDNYPFEIYAVKMLCDTAGSDAVLKAVTTGDMSPVYESLASYYGDIESAKKAIDIFNDFFLTINGDREKFVYSSDEMTKDLFEYLNAVAIAKYGEEKDGNFYRSAFFYHEIMFLNVFKDDSHTALLSDLEEFGVFCLPYFSSRLKEKFSQPTIGTLDTTTIVNKDDYQNVKRP